MAVVFYVDPKLADDSEQDGLNLITLSYTFYPVRALSGCARIGGGGERGGGKSGRI